MNFLRMLKEYHLCKIYDILPLNNEACPLEHSYVQTSSESLHDIEDEIPQYDNIL